MAKILVVDDEPSIRRVVRLGLTSLGHTICEAADGNEALAQFDAVGQVDLVITDVVMAGKDGIETLVELRKRRKDLKVLVISGGGQVGASTYLRMAGSGDGDAGRVTAGSPAVAPGGAGPNQAKQRRKPAFSASRSRLRPMNTSWLLRVSSAFHSRSG
jgi:CheY-like chemotaxis protein